jgi:hypothetical protein
MKDDNRVRSALTAPQRSTWRSSALVAAVCLESVIGLSSGAFALVNYVQLFVAVYSGTPKSPVFLAFVCYILVFSLIATGASYIFLKSAFGHVNELRG